MIAAGWLTVALLAGAGARPGAGTGPAPAAARAAAPKPAPPSAPKEAAGARAQGEAFALELVVPGAAGPGAAATAQVVLTARGPYHVNRDYPVSFRPDATSTAGLPGGRVPLGEGAAPTPCAAFPGETCSVSWPLRFTVAASGETRIAGVVSFSVCNPDRCLIEKVPLAAVVPAR